MKTVFVLQHMHVLPGGENDIKLIGVYQSSDAAVAAIERLKIQPGFSKHPRLIDPQVDDHVSGFFLDEYELDRDHWSEGFTTV